MSGVAAVEVEMMHSMRQHEDQENDNQGVQVKEDEFVRPPRPVSVLKRDVRTLLTRRGFKWRKTNEHTLNEFFSTPATRTRSR